MATSPGDLFRQARERGGYSLDTVMRATKIRPNIIEAIEEGEWHVLPSSYMKSFVRSYGKFLHLDEQEVETLCREHFNARIPTASMPPSISQAASPMTNGASTVYDAMAAHATPETPAQPFEQPYLIPSEAAAARASASVINRIVYASLALALVTIGYYYIVGNRSKATPAVTIQQTEINEADTSTPNANGTQAVLNATQDSSLTQAIAGQDTLLLEAKAIDSVWFNIVIDGKKSEQFITDPGKTYKWRGAIFALSLGNAGGIELTLNNVKLPPLGKAGVIVRDVKITKEGIKSSNLPPSMKTSFVPANQRPTTQESEKVGNPNSSLPTPKASVKEPIKEPIKESGKEPVKESNPSPKNSLPQASEAKPTTPRTLKNKDTRTPALIIQEVRPPLSAPTLQLQPRTRPDSVKN